MKNEKEPKFRQIWIFCDVHISSGEKQILETRCIKQHAFLVDPLRDLCDFSNAHTLMFFFLTPKGGLRGVESAAHIIQGRRGQVRRMEGETLGVLACRCPKLRLVDQWCGQQQIAILESDINVEFGNDAFTVKEFAVKFYSILLSCTEDDAFRFATVSRTGTG